MNCTYLAPVGLVLSTLPRVVLLLLLLASCKGRSFRGLGLLVLLHEVPSLRLCRSSRFVGRGGFGSSLVFHV